MTANVFQQEVSYPHKPRASAVVTCVSRFVPFFSTLWNAQNGADTASSGADLSNACCPSVLLRHLDAVVEHDTATKLNAMIVAL